MGSEAMDSNDGSDRGRYGANWIRTINHRR